LRGEAQLSFLTLPPCIPLIQSGRLRGIAVGTAKRSVALPDLPTVSEAGVPGFDVSAWNGILAPRGVPRALVVRLNRELNRIAETPDVRNRALAQGTELENQTPEEFAAFLAAQAAKWAKVAKAAGMRPD
jgi:tripartite-type tricarboxylate transporter receptor subunit TctC